ncbi:hypothetical protein DTO164E3_8359 [Paecilomyces variotii]|nr:hypothetical protein DTO164E3_8359 [Paecilomyces variotii]KAJ9207502.1 hypothetical protein DTO032I3_1146 [Paecilomyces variotii]KAJ9274153.1 hypothetical protein DTO021D3_8991 [Paecilomyces variotii]KAJ9342620.1 hypothetical protein DTO027B6_4739 [Paecilomyces variotii]KAJ9378541.1 hypothetical protein DTO032I4_7574 [Paecilomyces variotii]
MDQAAFTSSTPDLCEIGTAVIIQAVIKFMRQHPTRYGDLRPHTIIWGHRDIPEDRIYALEEAFKALREENQRLSELNSRLTCDLENLTTRVREIEERPVTDDPRWHRLALSLQSHSSRSEPIAELDTHISNKLWVVYKGLNNIIKIDDGPLVIEFDKLLLRSPSTPREKNVELGNLGSQHLATSIRSAQGFYNDERINTGQSSGRNIRAEQQAWSEAYGESQPWVEDICETHLS